MYNALSIRMCLAAVEALSSKSNVAGGLLQMVSSGLTFTGTIQMVVITALFALFFHVLSSSSRLSLKNFSWLSVDHSYNDSVMVNDVGKVISM